MHRARLLTLAAVVAATIAVTSAAAHPQVAPPQPAGPATFLSHVVRLLAANRYADAWASLNPSQQAIAPLNAYIACESQSPIPGHLVSLRVLRARHEQVIVLPEQPPVASIAVKFALRITGAALPDGLRVDLTAHAVAVSSRWTWILPPARLQLYQQGCGTESLRAP